MSAAKLYEGMFLFDANLAAQDWPGLENHVQELLGKNGAEIVHSERWPDRKLAYEIKGCKKGTYYLTYFRGPPDSVQGLKRDSQLSERILRLLVLYDEELVQDCDRRVRREISGSPEEIEQMRERAAIAQQAAAGEGPSGSGAPRSDKAPPTDGPAEKEAPKTVPERSAAPGGGEAAAPGDTGEA